MLDVDDTLSGLPWGAQEHLRKLISTTGVITLPGFLPDNTLCKLRREVVELLSQHHPHERFSHPFAEEISDEGVDWSFNTSRFIMMPGDRFPFDSYIWQLYRNSEFRGFLREVGGGAELFEYDFPKSSIEASRLRYGHINSWHYDRADIVVTIQLRKPREGGLFQLLPKRFCEGLDSQPTTKNLIQKADRHFICPYQDEGSATVFMGRKALHRVSEVQSHDERICLHLAYAYSKNARLPNTLRDTRHTLKASLSND